MPQPADIKNIPLATSARYKARSPEKGYEVTEKYQGYRDDPVRYVLKLSEFDRPILATPGATKFEWPGGIEGFSLASSALTGIHRYIGSADVDVDVISPDELHITLTGNFLGHNSLDLMQALRGVILDKSTNPSGKLLYLPRLLDYVKWVQIINHSFTHNEGDDTYMVTYSVEMINTGNAIKYIPSKLQTPIANPQSKTKPRGRRGGGGGGRAAMVGETVRHYAKRVYGDASLNTVSKLINMNADLLEAHGISVFVAAYAPLPAGLVLEF